MASARFSTTWPARLSIPRRWRIEDLSPEAHPASRRSRTLLLDRRDRLDSRVPRQSRHARGVQQDRQEDSSRKTIPCRPRGRRNSSSRMADVDEGITDLKKAIELKPDYDDAMAYLNLLYRQKADMETDPDARDDDLKLADDLVDKVKAIKQKKLKVRSRRRSKCLKPFQFFVGAGLRPAAFLPGCRCAPRPSCVPDGAASPGSRASNENQSPEPENSPAPHSHMN